MITNRIITKLAKDTGISGPMSNDFMKFALSVVEECAQFQEIRSTERHGYDKYDDAGAIRSHFS